jgi:hypothetical protein
MQPDEEEAEETEYGLSSPWHSCPYGHAMSLMTDALGSLLEHFNLQQFRATKRLEAGA